MRDVFIALDYKDIKKEIKRLNIDKEHLTNYGKIINGNSYNNLDTKKKHPHMVMIDEAGIYLLLNKSTKPLAEKFKNELFSDILPELRENGEFKFSTKDKLKLTGISKTLKNIRKKQLLDRKTQKHYINSTGNGYIYVIKVNTIIDGKEKTCYKIGYSKDLNTRLQTYKTGNPDIDLVYKENINCNAKQLEKCVLNLNILKRLSSKNEIICNSSLIEIKKEISDCKKLINKYSEKSNKSTIKNTHTKSNPSGKQYQKLSKK